MFRKVLVANRGEIAIRVMRACEELNVGTVAIYPRRTKMGHVRYADEAYNVGPARAADSYLDHEAVIEAACKADADAIHPATASRRTPSSRESRGDRRDYLDRSLERRDGVAGREN